MTARSFIDQYLAKLSSENRSALTKLRASIRLAAPDAEECVSYGLPAFRWRGKPFAAFSASANHCSYFPMSSKTIVTLKKELIGYDTSKGTIRFQSNQPIPARLIRLLVNARLKEIESRLPARAAAKVIAPRRSTKPKSKTDRTDARVDNLIQSTTHPRVAELRQLRRLILSVDSNVYEEWKWNSPSYRTIDYFATINLSSRAVLRLILHTGAKGKTSPSGGMEVNDPMGILQWLGKDRCMIMIPSQKEFAKMKPAIKAIVRSWIRRLVT